MKSESEFALDFLLKQLNVYLRPLGFKRFGRRFGRQTEECWQIIAVQTSRYSSSDSKNVTINFGATSKTLMEFRGENIAKAPLDYTCPIRFGVREPFNPKDYWWTIRDEQSAMNAYNAIVSSLDSRDIAFLNSLQSDIGILELYNSNQVFGFQIDADETRLVLLGHLGQDKDASERLRHYEIDWVPTAAVERAKRFLGSYRATFVASNP